MAMIHRAFGEGQIKANLGWPAWEDSKAKGYQEKLDAFLELADDVVKLWEAEKFVVTISDANLLDRFATSFKSIIRSNWPPDRTPEISDE